MVFVSKWYFNFLFFARLSKLATIRNLFGCWNNTFLSLFNFSNRQKSKKKYNNNPTSLKFLFLPWWSKNKQQSVSEIAQNYVFIIFWFSLVQTAWETLTLTHHKIYIRTHILCVENSTIRLVLTLLYIFYWMEQRAKWKKSDEENKNKTKANFFLPLFTESFIETVKLVSIPSAY